MKVPEPLQVVHVAEIAARGSGAQWLVEDLLVDEGVAVLGGNPKSCKTWLALDLALSVASGTPALGTYAVPRAGPAVVLVAEDPPHALRARVEGIATARGLSLSGLPLHVILAASLRLEGVEDQQRLADVVERLRPRLLVLDPFVRLSRVDENSAREVSGVLAYLRALQRSHSVAIVVVHHARKAGAGAAQAGLSLRGSSDFYAWGDEILHMRRRRSTLELVVEHRCAPSPRDSIQLELSNEGDAPPHLTVVQRGPEDVDADNLREQIRRIVVAATGPMTTEQVRKAAGVRWTRAAETLEALERQGVLDHTSAGWTARRATSA